MERRLHRSETDRFLSGVAGGMAEHFAWDPTLTRLGWIVVCFFTGGLAFLVYLVLWLVTPSYAAVYGVEQVPSASVVTVRSGGERRGRASTALVVGELLVIVGVLALLGSLGVYAPWDVFAPWNVWRIVWPLVLIGIGALFLVRR